MGTALAALTGTLNCGWLSAENVACSLTRPPRPSIHSNALYFATNWKSNRGSQRVFYPADECFAEAVR